MPMGAAHVLVTTLSRPLERAFTGWRRQTMCCLPAPEPIGQAVGSEKLPRSVITASL